MPLSSRSRLRCIIASYAARSAVAMVDQGKRFTTTSPHPTRLGTFGTNEGHHKATRLRGPHDQGLTGRNALRSAAAIDGAPALGAVPSSLEQRTVDDAAARRASYFSERGRKRRTEPVAQHRLDC